MNFNIPVHNKKTTFESIAEKLKMNELEEMSNYKKVEPILISDDIKKKMLSLCVASKTSEDLYVYSYKDNDIIMDYVSINGYIISYRIFTVLLLKSVFYNFGMPPNRWNILEKEIAALWSALGIDNSSQIRFVHLINLIKAKLKSFVEDDNEINIEIFQEHIRNLEEKFTESRNKLCN